MVAKPCLAEKVVSSTRAIFPAQVLDAARPGSCREKSLGALEMGEEGIQAAAPLLFAFVARVAALHME